MKPRQPFELLKTVPIPAAEPQDGSECNSPLREFFFARLNSQEEKLCGDFLLPNR